MISVDFSEIVPQQLLDLLGSDFVVAVLDDVAAVARLEWIKLAQTELHTSKRDYINSIQEVAGQGDERYISLIGAFANAVEKGIPAYELQETMLKGGEKHKVVPFQHGAASKMGARMGPQAMVSRAVESGLTSRQASSLGLSIYRRAKQLKAGEKLSTANMRGRGRSMIQVPKLAKWHKTDIFSGMIRTPREEGGGTYSTFRTISADSIGWLHPGIEARNLAEKVEAKVESMVDTVIRTTLNQALKAL